MFVELLMFVIEKHLPNAGKHVANTRRLVLRAGAQIANFASLVPRGERFVLGPVTFSPSSARLACW